MEHLTFIDYIIIVLLLWGFITGFRKGLIMQLTLIAGIVLGLWLGSNSLEFVEKWLLEQDFSGGVWLKPIAFLIIFISVYGIAYVSGKALSALISLIMLGIFNKIAGGIFGMLKMMLLSSIFIVLINATGFSNFSKEQEKSSAMFESVSSIAVFLFPTIEKNITSSTKSLF
jgi:membrane protein required for colicin V production